ncbi:MAG: hypothetical protein DRI86_12575 [Bacteroidetes bacterium]|nr:MAG: hypothetical protein DRI86_12575 [Bacteroidota bacterium]
MNKFYITLAIVLAGFTANAQNFKMGPKLSVSQAKVEAIRTAAKKQASNSKAINSQWYNYALCMDSLIGDIGSLSGNYLFPDTTIRANFAGTADATPWVHSLACILDPKSSTVFRQDGIQMIDMNTPYTLDSVSFYCSYIRNTEASIVDTLVFEFLTTNSHSEVPKWQFTSSGIKFFGLLRTGLYFDAASKVTYKLPISVNDSAANFGWMKRFQVAVPSAVSINPNEMICYNVTFLPGYSFNGDDTLNTKNYIQFYSMEENGEDTDPTYTDGDWNSSQILTTSGLYPEDAIDSSWMDSYVPEWAYMTGYGFENHLMGFLLTADAGYNSISNTSTNGLSVSQNMPNPFSGNSTINYSLNEKSEVSLEVYNVTGSKVMELNEGVKTAGNHSIQIDASNLNAGVYYYSVIAGDKRITKKMIVY